MERWALLRLLGTLRLRCAALTVTPMRSGRRGRHRGRHRGRRVKAAPSRPDRGWENRPGPGRAHPDPGRRSLSEESALQD